MKEWKSSVSRMANGCTLKNFYPVALYSMDQLIFRLDSFINTHKKKMKRKEIEKRKTYFNSLVRIHWTIFVKCPALTDPYWSILKRNRLDGSLWLNELKLPTLVAFYNFPPNNQIAKYQLFEICMIDGMNELGLYLPNYSNWLPFPWVI